MKNYSLIGIILFFVFFITTAKAQKTAETDKQMLSAEDKRKFDYFYLEAIRLKENNRHSDAFSALTYALEIDSTSSAALYELSNYYLFLGQGDLAIEVLRSAVKFSRDNFEYKNSLASVARELDMKDEAISIYEELVKKYPDKSELNYYLSDLYTRKGQVDKAIQALDALEENMGMNEALSLQKFRLYNMIEQKDQAFKEVEKLAAKYPLEAKYQIILGDLHLEQKEPDKALLNYQKAHTIDPENPYYIVSMANYYEYKEDNEAASNEIEMALKNPKLDVETKLGILGRYIQTLQQNKKEMDRANALFETLMDQYSQEKELNLMYGQFLLMQNKTEEAKFQFQVVTEATPENVNAWKQLLGIYIKENDMDNSIEICNQALVHFPETPEFYFYKGAAYYQKKEYQQALDIYQEGLKIVADDEPAFKSDFYGQIGDLYYHLKQKDKAYESYDAALEYNNQNIVVLNNYAYFLSLDKKDLSKAERMSNQCVKLQPDNPTYIDTYAWVFFVQGNYSLAKFYIERAMSKDSEKSAEIIEHYGDILFMSGEQEKGIEQWEKALELKEKESGDEASIFILKKKISEKKYYENHSE